MPDTVTALQFVNMEDRYIYDAAISANSYQLKLRNGTYEVKAEAGDYQTVSHIVVENQAVARDLLFLTTKKKNLNGYRIFMSDMTRRSIIIRRCGKQ